MTVKAAGTWDELDGSIATLNRPKALPRIEERGTAEDARFGYGLAGKVRSGPARQERANHLPVLPAKDRAGGVEELPARAHAGGGPAKELELQRG